MDLKGKSIDFLGDSITEGAGVEVVPEHRFDCVLKDLAGLREVHNYGVGGSRIAHQRRASEFPRFDLCFCGRAFDMDKDADAVVVFGGTNDYGHGDAPFGEETDLGAGTYCGAVNLLMETLRTVHPGAQVVFMTPCRRKDDALPSTEVPGLTGKRPLKDYVDVILRAGERHGIPVLDLYSRLPIDPNLPEHQERYAPDGLHLNDAGHKMLAELLKDFLEAL